MNNYDEPRYKRLSTSYESAQIIYVRNGVNWESVAKTGD